MIDSLHKLIQIWNNLDRSILCGSVQNSIIVVFRTQKRPKLDVRKAGTALLENICLDGNASRENR